MGSSSALAADSPLPTLSLTGESELAITGSESKDTATAELFVTNPGKAVPITVDFVASGASGVEVSKFEPTQASAEGATPVEVTFTGLAALDAATSGAIVVRGGAAPVFRQAKLSPGLQPSRDWPTTLVIVALVAMLALFAAIAAFAVLRDKAEFLTKQAPGPKWSFESWATTLTAVGAIVGTVVAAVTYPKEPKQIDKDTLVALVLLFGALVVIAPFVFQSMRNPRASANDQEAGLWGYNWALLVSCAVTCGAVLGELGCLGLLSRELIGSGGWADAALVVVALLALMTIYYFLVTAWSLVSTDWADLVAKAKAKAEKDEKRGLVIGIAGPARAIDDVETAEVSVVSVQPQARTWSLP
ncbi:MAG: hypothetical protein ABW196_08990 [Solirubrobacterales bacterium]